MKNEESAIFDILNTLFQPISYKSILWSNIPTELEKNAPLLEDFSIAKYSNNFQCYPIRNIDNFKLECSGLKVVFHNSAQKKSLIVTGIINEISMNCISNSYILSQIHAIRDLDDDIDESLVERYIASLTVKDLLIHSALELRNILYSNISSMKLLKSKSLMSIVKQFIKGTIIEKRHMLIQLLLFNNETDFQYIAYLLYDLLTSDSNNTIDSKEQLLLFDSLPMEFKKYFKDAMNSTLSYTEELYNFSNNIPLEQQICLLKVNDAVKEKAMIKLKEIKAKSDDTGSKARQYLEGLLRIPFGQYKQEEVMNLIPNTINNYNIIIDNLPSVLKDELELEYCSTYIQVQNKDTVLKDILEKTNDVHKKKIIETLTNGKKNDLIKSVSILNQFIKKNDIKIKRISHSGKNNDVIKNDI